MNQHFEVCEHASISLKDYKKNFQVKTISETSKISRRSWSYTSIY